MKKFLVAQIPNEDYPYILLFIQRTIYIFNEDKSLLKSQSVTYEQLTGDTYLKLIPYKKDNNLLYFFISFYDYNHINLLKFTYDLSNPTNDISAIKQSILLSEGEYSVQISGLSCVIMPPYEPLNIENDLITFFYFKTYPLVFYSFTLEIGDEYTKVYSFSLY